MVVVGHMVSGVVDCVLILDGDVFYVAGLWC